MNAYQKQPDRWNEPEKAKPPHPPRDLCGDVPDSPDAPKFEPHPCPPPDCKCPEGPGSETNCIEDLIAKQAAEIARAEKAKTFKADLEALLAKAKAVKQDYTREKYEKLCRQWAEQDGQIAELIRKLDCALPCWRCVIDCHICSLINDLHTAQQWLDGDKGPHMHVHNLYDLQYWYARDKEEKERRFNQIKSVLAVWEKPAQTIEKNLADNVKLMADAAKLLGLEPWKAIYDIFFRLVPMHLAIAPPGGLDWDTNGIWRTNILDEWTNFCPCDEEKPDPCCGLDFGEMSLRQRLIGPQPHLIDPGKYFELICCLIERRYEPAKSVLTKAEVDLAAVDDRIKSLKAKIENGLKSFDKDAKGAIPSGVNCADYESNETDSDYKQSR